MMQYPGMLRNGCEQYEFFTSVVLKEELVQYDYRSLDGMLFSCIAKNIPEARVRRNKWEKDRGLPATLRAK